MTVFFKLTAPSQIARSKTPKDLLNRGIAYVLACKFFLIILICGLYIVYTTPVLASSTLNQCNPPSKSVRKLKDDEKLFLSKIFPDLNLENVLVHGKASENYNCIAWSVGITDQWINPPDTLEEFRKFYKDNKYTQVSKNNKSRVIDGWGKYNITDEIKSFTHGSRYCSNLSTGTWTSKLGGYLLISHSEMDLKSETYGDIFEGYASDNDKPVTYKDEL